jgi:hypothetical protein
MATAGSPSSTAKLSSTGGGSGVLVDYPALRSVMRQVKAVFSGSMMAYPKIGAGLAKGDWSIITSII